MKDKKLLVNIRETTKDFYLFQPAADDDWHVRFTPPRWMRERLKLRQKRVTRSIGTKLLAPARKRAEQILSGFYAAVDVSAADALRLRNDFSKVGELLEIYLARATQKPVTFNKNADSLGKMIAVVHGGAPNEYPLSVLNKELTREFEQKRFDGRMARERQRAIELNESARELEIRLAKATQKVRQSTAAYVRQAKAVVSLEKMKFYEGLRLPDLAGFRNERVVKPRKSLPKPLDLNALRALEAARPLLIEKDPAVYVANLMFAHWGMRDIEILNARTWWLMDNVMHIIDRAEENFFPKGCEGSFDVSPDVVAEILRFQSLCVDGYLVPGRNMSERYDAIYRRHSTWCRTWIKDHTKTSYELRRYAGSRLLDLGWTLEEVRDFLRHRMVQTTRDWYAYQLRRPSARGRKLPTIGLRDLVPNEEVA